MIAIPCFNFPTIVLALDDEEHLLHTIKRILRSEYKLHCITSINEAKTIVKKNMAWVNELIGTGFSRSFDTQSSKFSVTLDIEVIQKIINNPNRFNHITIMILDYDMPDMNGLDLVRSLGDHQIKIIMLTGKVGQDTVIEAFNNKEIHRYIPKSKDYFKIVLEYIKELKKEFFLDFSKVFIETLKVETKIFTNPLFIEMFNKIIDENNIVEYYLLDESGSFLLLDASADNQIWLIVKSKNDMRLFYDLALEDPATPTDIIEKLKNCEVFTHFKTEKESYLNAKDWNLIDCKPLDAEKEFYYAVLKNDDNFKIDRSKIKSYADFLNESDSNIEVNYDEK